MKKQQLSVRLYGKEIGILEQNSSGKLNFIYKEDNNISISNSLPLTKKEFNDKECRPYFNGLLPESDIVRKYLGKIFGINANNDFSLLQAIGHDCAGALSLHSLEEPVNVKEYIKLEYEPLTDKQLKKHIEELPYKPFFAQSDNDVRLSLAGTQDKGAITLINNRVCLPKNSTPTTHILKPLITNLSNTIINEYVCMKTAKKLSINVSEVKICEVENLKYLLIERYDRQIKNDMVKRIHQEDFCQALGILSINKYQADGGPNIKACFDLLDITKVPAISRNMLMKIFIFNFLIGNNDAHAKNFSLLYVEDKPVLAPAYDIVCTQMYPELTKKMAMKIGSIYDKKFVTKVDFEKMCNEINYSYKSFSKEFINMATVLPNMIKEESSNFNKKEKKFINKIIDVVETNSKIAQYL